MAYVTRRQRAERRKKKFRRLVITSLLLLVACLTGYIYLNFFHEGTAEVNYSKLAGIVPEYDSSSSEAYVEINGGKPFFTKKEITTEAFEDYSKLDELGRCGVAFANVCPETMPTEKRGSIGMIKPTGWVQNKYPGIVESNPPYLYNRCHLIAYCLTAENANDRNLITGTRYMNVRGMLPFEEKVARYIDDTGNHVLYRVTPDFRKNNLLANGVLMEAYSVEDEGEGVCFCVYCYNVQPGVEIDYSTGENEV